MIDSCRLCGQAELLPLIDFGAHPFSHNYLPDPAAKEQVHPVKLSFCERCGLIQLVDPVSPDLLYTEYVCLSSWKFQPHIPRMIDLIDGLPGLDKAAAIGEIASNDGIFLQALKERGYRNILGIEPALDARASAGRKGLETIGGYFTPEMARTVCSSHGRRDLLVARQVLEHITDLEAFGEAVRLFLRPGGYVVIEVPNHDFSLDMLDYSVIWEEHVNYFGLDTLRLYLAKLGIRVIHSETVTFSGDTLIVVGEYLDDGEARPANGYLEKLRAKTLAYRDGWPVFRDSFIEYLHDHRQAGGRAVIYGAGNRSCSLINFVGLGPYIECVVDDQLEKQGLYMPGSHLPIVAGDTLEQQDADLCLLAVNAENEDKVMAKHSRYTDQGGKFVAIFPPSDNLAPFWNRLLAGNRAG